MAIKDLTGEKFFNWKVISRGEKRVFTVLVVLNVSLSLGVVIINTSLISACINIDNG